MNGQVEYVLSDEALQAALNDHADVVVKFGASWCGPCRQLAPIFAAAAAEHSELHFVDVDTDLAPTLAVQLGIRSVPTLVRFTSGETKASVVNPGTAAKLRDFLAA